MSSEIETKAGALVESVLSDCVTALRRSADYRLPPALDRRFLWLAENKETLSAAEREEFLALADFSEEKTIEKLQARAVLKRLAEIYPHLVSEAM